MTADKRTRVSIITWKYTVFGIGPQKNTTSESSHTHAAIGGSAFDQISFT